MDVRTLIDSLYVDECGWLCSDLDPDDELCATEQAAYVISCLGRYKDVPNVCKWERTISPRIWDLQAFKSLYITSRWH